MRALPGAPPPRSSKASGVPIVDATGSEAAGGLRSSSDARFHDGLPFEPVNLHVAARLRSLPIAVSECRHRPVPTSVAAREDGHRHALQRVAAGSVASARLHRARAWASNRRDYRRSCSCRRGCRLNSALTAVDTDAHRINLLIATTIWWPRLLAAGRDRVADSRQTLDAGTARARRAQKLCGTFALSASPAPTIRRFSFGRDADAGRPRRGERNRRRSAKSPPAAPMARRSATWILSCAKRTAAPTTRNCSSASRHSTRGQDLRWKPAGSGALPGVRLMGRSLNVVELAVDSTLREEQRTTRGAAIAECANVIVRLLAGSTCDRRQGAARHASARSTRAGRRRACQCVYAKSAQSSFAALRRKHLTLPRVRPSDVLPGEMFFSAALGLRSGSSSSVSSSMSCPSPTLIGVAGGGAAGSDGGSAARSAISAGSSTRRSACSADTSTISVRG